MTVDINSLKRLFSTPSTVYPLLVVFNKVFFQGEVFNCSSESEGSGYTFVAQGWRANRRAFLKPNPKVDASSMESSTLMCVAMSLPNLSHNILVLLTRKNVTESWKVRIFDSIVKAANARTRQYERDAVSSVWEDLLTKFLPAELLRKVDTVPTIHTSAINCGLNYKSRGTCFLTPCLVLAHSIVVATQDKKTFQSGEDFYHFVLQLNGRPSNIPVHLLISDWAHMLSNARKRQRENDEAMEYFEQWSKGLV